MKPVTGFDVANGTVAGHKVIVNDVRRELLELYGVCLAGHGDPTIDIGEALPSDLRSIFGRKDPIIGGQRLPMATTVRIFVVDAEGLASTLANTFESLILSFLSHQ